MGTFWTKQKRPQRKMHCTSSMFLHCNVNSWCMYWTHLKLITGLVYVLFAKFIDLDLWYCHVKDSTYILSLHHTINNCHAIIEDTKKTLCRTWTHVHRQLHYITLHYSWRTASDVLQLSVMIQTNLQPLQSS